jgi:hypothetical protein
MSERGKPFMYGNFIKECIMESSARPTVKSIRSVTVDGDKAWLE